MKPRRTAVVGAGRSVGNHLGAIDALPSERIQLVAIVDSDATSAQRAIGAREGVTAYSSMSTMLRAESPDLVQIVTPPATHLELCVEALEAGAWVLCEKPLCMSLAEFESIAAAERATGGYVSAVSQWRYGSAAQLVRRLIDEGVLGRALLGVCNTLWYRPESYYTGSWHGSWATDAGGPSATLGIHLMDLCLWLMGEWTEVSARMATLARDIEVEDVSLATVSFASGALGSFVNSAVSPRQSSYLRLDFEHATAEVDALYRYSNADWRLSVPDGATRLDPLARWRELDQDRGGRHEAQLERLLDALDAGVRPPSSGDEALRVLEFLAALYKSAITGERVGRGSITRDDPFFHAMNGRPTLAPRGTARLP